MYAPELTIHSAVIAPHPSLPYAAQLGQELADRLRVEGVAVEVIPSMSEADLAKKQVDVFVAIGGDGTMLRAGHLCAPQGIPILGINVGQLGFLTELSRTGWMSRIPDLLAGKFQVEQRMMLHAEHWRGGKCLEAWEVLNEIVVCRGETVRPVQLIASLDGYPLATYIADGLIVATATGSTAYALAVGGPIMPPELRNILIIPVAPHFSLNRAVILPEGAQVGVTVQTRHDVVSSVDGHKPVHLESGDEIRASAGQYTAQFIRFQDPGYFYRNLTHYMEKNPAAGDPS